MNGCIRRQVLEKNHISFSFFFSRNSLFCSTRGPRATDSRKVFCGWPMHAHLLATTTSSERRSRYFFCGVPPFPTSFSLSPLLPGPYRVILIYGRYHTIFHEHVSPPRGCPHFLHRNPTTLFSFYSYYLPVRCRVCNGVRFIVRDCMLR